MIMRFFDLIFAVALMILLSPLFFMTMLIVLFALGRPIFFTQPRVGKNNHIFKLYKFRTMKNPTKTGQNSDAARLTPVGAWLRKWSLDEWPQLWNILRNDMSFVGPRPLLVEYLERYSAFQRRRHEVKPGITGWAQVHGRNAILWEEKFKLDVWYVDHQSPWLNMRILFMTVRVVLCGRQTSRAGVATTPPFTGQGE